ncbi:MAG TPA: carbon starvation protein A, partial [Sphingomonadales bacterium]
VCTMTAGWQKLFHSDPAIGFLAQRSLYEEALARGDLLGPAKSLDDMRQIIGNAELNAGLTAAFLLVVAAMVVFGVRRVLEARRVDHPTARETMATAPHEAGLRA